MKTTVVSTATTVSTVVKYQRVPITTPKPSPKVMGGESDSSETTTIRDSLTAENHFNEVVPTVANGEIFGFFRFLQRIRKNSNALSVCGVLLHFMAFSYTSFRMSF